jgi:copper chaperone CopZ
MKRIILAAILCLGFLGVANAQSSKKETLIIKTKIYCDHCMKCGSCAGRMNLALKKYPGVSKIDIAPESNTITVVYNPKKTTPDKIRKSISDAGFDADDVKANPEAVTKLDDCCQPQ